MDEATLTHLEKIFPGEDLKLELWIRRIAPTRRRPVSAAWKTLMLRAVWRSSHADAWPQFIVPL